MAQAAIGERLSFDIGRFRARGDYENVSLPTTRRRTRLQRAITLKLASISGSAKRSLTRRAGLFDWLVERVR